MNQGRNNYIVAFSFDDKENPQAENPVGGILSCLILNPGNQENG